MREAKRNRSGWSNRTVPKSKRTNASHSFIRNQFLGDFNKKHGIGLIILSLIVIGGIGGYYLYQTPAFHSYNYDTNVCIPTQKEIKNDLPCGDPSTRIWDTQLSNNDLSEFQVDRATFINSGSCTSFSGSPKCISLNPDSNGPSVVLSKNSIGDLSVSANKNLYFEFHWKLSGTPNTNKEMGFFLTTNKTFNPLPSDTNYNPGDDTSVYLIDRFVYQGSNVFRSDVLLKRNIALDTINSEDIGGSGQSGSNFLVVSSTTSTFTTNYQILSTYLNFTGPASGTCNNGAGGLGVGCSSISLDGTSNSNQAVPWFLVTQQYYIGFYALTNLGTNLIIVSDDSNLPGITCSILVIQPLTLSPQQYDSGGFFGPIIRWFINGAVFVFQNIINFFSYLGSILSPVLAGVIALFSGVFIAVFNALGGIFGDNQLGTQIGTFFINLSSYLTNVFSLAIIIIAGIAGPNGLLSNAVQIAINFLSGSNSFIGVLVTLATGLAGLIPALSGFWTLLVSLFNLGIAGADFIIIIMLVLLEFAAITDWIQDDNPIDALVAIPLAFFLFYFLANAPSSINIIALNTSVSSNYLTAWNNIIWFVKLFPIIFFAIFFEWTMSLDETQRFHRQQTTILHNFFSVIKFYRLLTVDVVMGSWWFFDNAYDIITKGLTAIKGRWSPVEVAGTG